MYQYRERTSNCSGCNNNSFPEAHKLFHETGVSVNIICELNLTTKKEVENAFRSSISLTKCYISLNGRKTKIREENKYLFPEDMITLIPNLKK